MPPLLTRLHLQETLEREAPSQTTAPEPTYGNKRNYCRRFALRVLRLCHHYALALFASARGAVALFACKIGSGFCAGGLGAGFFPRARARI